MEVLASRIGRLEATVDGVRREVFALQAGAPARPGSGVARQGSGAHGPQFAAAAEAPQAAALAEWVRLFERELETVERTTRACEAAVLGLEGRMKAVEGECASPADLEELGELLLGELRSLQVEVHRLSGTEVPEDLARGPPIAFTGRRQAYRAEAQARLERLEQTAQRAVSRLELLEAEILLDGPGGNTPGGTVAAPAKLEAADNGGDRKAPGGSVASRLRWLEGEVGVALEPLRRHAVSLRALEETSAKVEELQRVLAGVPGARAVDQSAHAVRELGGGAKDAGGLSVFDAYRIQSMLEQVMSAMEALSRQRNDDVRLVNNCLAEVYARMERDLVRDGGIADAAPFKSLRAEVVNLAARVDALVGVQLEELEHRLLHEGRVARQEAASCSTQLGEIREAARKALERCADAEVRLQGLSTLAENRALVNTRQEATAGELHREVAKLRTEVAEMAQGYKGGANIEMEARLAAVRAEFEAQMARQAREAGRHADSLAREVQSLREQGDHVLAVGGTSGGVHEEIEMLCRDFAALRGDCTRSDIELRERMAQGERELRAEIRAAQRLMLEVAEQLRVSGRPPGRANAGAIVGAAEAGGFAQLSHMAATPAAAAAAASAAAAGLPALAFAAADAEPEAGLVVPVANGAVEWRVPDVRKLAREGDRRALFSAPFSIPRLAELRPGDGSLLKLKLFPLGSRRQTQPGNCSLYLSGPEGIHLQFTLRLGSAEHGPLECFFDRPNKDTGRHDFCALEDHLEADGSAVVRLTVTKVSARGSAARAVSPGGTVTF